MMILCNNIIVHSLWWIWFRLYAGDGGRFISQSLRVSRLYQFVDLVVSGHHGHRIVRRPLRHARRKDHLAILVVLAVFGGFHVFEKSQYLRVLGRRFAQFVQLSGTQQLRLKLLFFFTGYLHYLQYYYNTRRDRKNNFRIIE